MKSFIIPITRSVVILVMYISITYSYQIYIVLI